MWLRLIFKSSLNSSIARGSIKICTDYLCAAKITLYDCDYTACVIGERQVKKNINYTILLQRQCICEILQRQYICEKHKIINFMVGGSDRASTFYLISFAFFHDFFWVGKFELLRSRVDAWHPS